ncbi:MAG: hypothetical protein EBR82_00265 [Caulobacteraceae bacterium]|nr:hypothetical protein [Caulobacteraceae bacterium]
MSNPTSVPDLQLSLHVRDLDFPELGVVPFVLDLLFFTVEVCEPSTQLVITRVGESFHVDNVW